MREARAAAGPRVYIRAAVVKKKKKKVPGGGVNSKNKKKKTKFKSNENH